MSFIDTHGVFLLQFYKMQYKIYVTALFDTISARNDTFHFGLCIDFKYIAVDKLGMLKNKLPLTIRA